MQLLCLAGKSNHGLRTGQLCGQGPKALPRALPNWLFLKGCLRPRAGISRAYYGGVRLSHASTLRWLLCGLLLIGVSGAWPASQAQASGPRGKAKQTKPTKTAAPTWKRKFNQVLRKRIVKAGDTLRTKLSHSPRVLHRDATDTVFLASSKNGTVNLQVVPREASREHVARKMGGLIRRSDIKTVLGHMSRAEALAKHLGVQDAKIWIQPEGKTSIGQLQIHVEGTWSKPDVKAEVQESLNPYLANHRARIQAERKVGLENIGAIFQGIATKQEWQGQHVLLNTSKTLAFVDRTDAAHPAYNPKNYVDVGARHIPPEKLAHILVIPKSPRQHITMKLGEPIRKSDLVAVDKLLKSAEKLAKTYKISKPDIWINAESRIGVGYLHAHIAGIKTAETVYPKALRP